VGGLVEIAFSISAYAENRIPGILIKTAPAGGSPARRPAIIALHGTGQNKEGQRVFLTELAGAGFVGVAIDGRYHGARAKGGKEARATDYVSSIIRAFRTGREHPFFFDTAWDVMRLIDYLETRADIDPQCCR